MRFVQVNKKNEKKNGIRAVDTIHSCVHGSRVREKCFISFLSFSLFLCSFLCGGSSCD